MESAYQNAVARRGTIKKDIAKLEAELSRIDGWLDMYREFSRGTEQAQSHHITVPLATAVTTIANDVAALSEAIEKQRGLTRAAGAPIIRKLLIDNGKPMQRGALLNALDLNGTPVGGLDPSNNLGTMMWRMKDKFVNLDGHGYWPIDLSYEPAGYRGRLSPGEIARSAAESAGVVLTPEEWENFVGGKDGEAEASSSPTPDADALFG